MSGAILGRGLPWDPLPGSPRPRLGGSSHLHGHADARGHRDLHTHGENTGYTVSENDHVVGHPLVRAGGLGAHGAAPRMWSAPPEFQTPPSFFFFAPKALQIELQKPCPPLLHPDPMPS